MNPISVYWLVRDGVEKQGWRCASEVRQLWETCTTITVLRLLGHRWPRQVQAVEAVPEWADRDGIIPLTQVSIEVPLCERVRMRLVDVGVAWSHFVEVLGKPVDLWLSTEFFKHHTKQFKKRPIAWQIQSGKFTAKKSPAFACLVYYHKLDGDTLPKIRSQYVRPLRQRLETELRGIEAVPKDARNDRQTERRGELMEAIDELTEFENRLERVSREGFATTRLDKRLAGEPLDAWCSPDGRRPPPATPADFLAQESAYLPDINDGVRVNIAPLQKAGLLAADVVAKKDVDKAIADRAEWRADERRWVREGKLPQPGWWPAPAVALPKGTRTVSQPGKYVLVLLIAMLRRGGGRMSLSRLARAYALLMKPQALPQRAPGHLKDLATEWAAKYVDSPDAGFFRAAVLDLIGREQLDGAALREGVVALTPSATEHPIDEWVMCDAEIALATVDALPVPREESQIVKELMAAG